MKLIRDGTRLFAGSNLTIAHEAEGARMWAGLIPQPITLIVHKNGTGRLILTERDEWAHLKLGASYLSEATMLYWPEGP